MKVLDFAVAFHLDALQQVAQDRGADNGRDQ
jgi:hypothetical protein